MIGNASTIHIIVLRTARANNVNRHRVSYCYNDDNNNDNNNNNNNNNDNMKSRRRRVS